MKWSMSKSLLIWISLVFLLSACSSAGSDNALMSEAVREQLQNSKEDQGQTITLKQTTDSNINQRAGGRPDISEYKIQTRLTDFQLLSASAGVAWGITRNELRIYVTQSNGKTWDNVSPAKTVSFSEPPVYGSSIFFLNQKNGWVARNANGVGQTLILHTVDGGQNWNVATFNDNGTVLGMYFINEKTGWVMTSTDESNHQKGKAFYRTEDGGDSWTRLMKSSSSINSADQTTNELPQSGTLIGMSFRDNKHGFITLEKDGQPSLYTTADSGKTWTASASFLSKEVKSCDRITTGKPQFYGTSKTSGWMNIGCVKGTQTSYSGYFTEDGGKTWTHVAYTLKPQTGINQTMGPTFLNRKQGWSLIDGIIYTTQDQGHTWKALPANDTLQKTIANYPEMAKLQFFSKDVGWLLVAKNEERRSLLMQTTDGGKSWHVL